MAAYQSAIDSRHPLVAAKAAFNLGRLLADHGDRVAASEAYREAVNLGDADLRPKAA